MLLTCASVDSNRVRDYSIGGSGRLAAGVIVRISDLESPHVLDLWCHVVSEHVHSIDNKKKHKHC